MFAKLPLLITRYCLWCIIPVSWLCVWYCDMMLRLCCSRKPSVQSHCAPHDGCIQTGCAGELLCKYTCYIFWMTGMCCVLRVNKCDNLCYSELVALGGDTGLPAWGFGFSHRSDLCMALSSYKLRHSHFQRQTIFGLWSVSDPPPHVKK